jgi:hypothetical protein
MLRPKTRRRRSGEDTRDAFPPTWRRLIRRIRPAESHTAGSIFPSEMLDWSHLWHSDATQGTDHHHGTETTPNHLTPHI